MWEYKVMFIKDLVKKIYQFRWKVEFECLVELGFSQQCIVDLNRKLLKNDT